MQYKLALATIISIFGRGAENPRAATITRLFAALSTALATTLIVMPSITKIQLPNDLPQSWLMLCLIVLTQVLTSLIIFIISGVLISSDVSHRLSLTWPISQGVRYFLSILPSLVLVLLALILLSGPLLILANKLSMNIALTSAGLLLGVTSGFGIATYRPARSIVLSIGLAIVLFLTELLIITQTIETLSQGTQFITDYLIWASYLVTCPIFWIFLNIKTYDKGIKLAERPKKQISIMIYKKPIWHLMKFGRAARSRTSWLTSFGLSIGFVGISIVRSVPIGDAGMYIIVAALLAGAVSADTRPITNKFAPSEIVMLKGVRYYFRNLITSAEIAAISSVLPIILYILLLRVSAMSLLVVYLGLAISLGILASTILVPANKDVLGQFFSAVLSFIAIIWLPQISVIQKLSDKNQKISLILLAVVFLLFAYFIERNRNYFVWRKIHV